MKLVITQNITLDGVIEQSGDWFSVAGGEQDTSDVEDSLREMMSHEDAQILGRTTFEDMRGYWPNQTDDTTGITNHLNHVDKYVISTTMHDPGWENSTVLRGDVLAEVRSLKREPGANVGVTGSISVCHTLIGAELVDEYRLLVYPVVVGRGRRLFDENNAIGLKLTDVKRFRSGIALLCYEPA